MKPTNLWGCNAFQREVPINDDVVLKNPSIVAGGLACAFQPRLRLRQGPPPMLHPPVFMIKLADV